MNSPLSSYIDKLLDQLLASDVTRRIRREARSQQ